MKKRLFSHLPSDIPAGLVVFLVAVPLCLGISLASGAYEYDFPILAGLISGMIGGLIVTQISRSELSVSGPAAGLVAIVLMGLESLGSFEAFLVATFIAGVFQVILGLLKAGNIVYFFPSAVIKGMLAGIGLIIILKMIPHAIGYDKENFGSFEFSVTEVGNTFSILISGLKNLETGALIIGIFSIFIMWIWGKVPALKKLYWLPGGLVAVIIGVILNGLFSSAIPSLYLGSEHLVSLTGISTPADVLNKFTFPDWTALTNFDTYVVGLTVCIVASLESLLCVEAVDKLDPLKRKSPINRELFAQGTGNVISGLIGGLPITTVIVRSSTAVMAGGRTRMTAFSHGVFLIVAVFFGYNLLNLIPMASLAGILIMVGYNLASPSKFRQMYQAGKSQLIPFAATAFAILFTDLLTGVVIGLILGIIVVLRNNYLIPYHDLQKDNNTIKIHLAEHVTFMNKASIRKALEQIPEGGKAIVYADRVKKIDYDTLEVLEEFNETARDKKIEYVLKNFEKFH